jgi:hypothetical protein
MILVMLMRRVENIVVDRRKSSRPAAKRRKTMSLSTR